MQVLKRKLTKSFILFYFINVFELGVIKKIEFCNTNVRLLQG